MIRRTKQKVRGADSEKFVAAFDALLAHIGPSDLKTPPPSLPFRSETCNSHHFLHDCYRYWCQSFQETPRFHRKQWEYVYILQSLWERGLLNTGMRGLGFGVGSEPLSAVFARHGCEIVASDLPADRNSLWIGTADHAIHLDQLNSIGLCPQAQFEQQVRLRHVDMNQIPPDLKNFDFCWSSCCFEHLGSLALGIEFFVNSMDTLRPGGVAVHTTEYNLSSNRHTVSSGGTVIYRRRDIEELAARLRAAGHHVEPILVHQGSHLIDDYIDIAPYNHDRHLRISLSFYDTTSIGIIARKGGGQ